MSSADSIESLISQYEEKTDAAIAELQRKLTAAIGEREMVGDISDLRYLVDDYKKINKVNNEDLSLLSGISSNSISKMMKKPETSKVETVLALLDVMGMTLTISRKSLDE